MQNDLIELVWNSLQADLDKVRKQVTLSMTRFERSETTGGVIAGKLSDAPKAVDGANSGDLMFLTNVRKVGEGAGSGTGTICYYNPGTDSWFRVGDDTAAAI